jgi:ESCRT-II complex subunit VPS36
MPSSTSWSPFDCLATAEQTASGLLQRDGSEIELTVQEGVELRAAAAPDEPAMVPLTDRNGVDGTRRPEDWVDRRSGLTLTVTTHRIVLFGGGGRAPRYLHLSNVFSAEDETAYFRSPKILLCTAVGDLLLVFPRRGLPSGGAGDSRAARNRDEALRHVRKALERRQWEQDDDRSRQKKKEPAAGRRRVGVDAILSSTQARHRQAAALTEQAFEGDADQLLREAAELVQVIHKYVATLDKHSDKGGGGGDDDDEDADKLADLLQDMGMTSALSRADFRGREEAYYEQTARQIADFLSRKQETVLTLTDVYCLFNRARGSHLLSPEDLIKAVERMDGLDLGVSLVTFPSGLKVLQKEEVNEDVLAARFLSMCDGADGYVTALSVSRQTHVPVVLAQEQLLVAERAEHLVRDETLESVQFYPNKFRQFYGELQQKKSPDGVPS